MAIQFVKDPVKIIQTAGTSYIGDDSDQTYLISPTLVNEGDTITIIDKGGNNIIQFADGVEIINSIVVSNEAILTLGNGTAVDIRGADTFKFNLGGNVVTGAEGVDKTFGEFAQEVLNSPLPAEGEPPVERDVGVVINDDGSVSSIEDGGGKAGSSGDNYTTVALTGDTVGQEGVAENFTYQIDSSTGNVVSLVGSDITLEGFTVGEDILTFVDVENGTVTTETFTTEVSVSPSYINNRTDIYFDKDDAGNIYQLGIIGVVDDTLGDLGINIVQN